MLAVWVLHRSIIKMLPHAAQCFSPCRRLPGLMTQQMQNLQLSQTRKCPGGPASPSAAKRLYRNLSEKLRGSTSSFEDTYFFGKTDRLRKASVSVPERRKVQSHRCRI